MTPEAPDVAETVNFLRRFSGLMSNGNNAEYLQRAADLLETLTARVIAASDEDELWRYKYEAVAQHASELEAECEALKHDIEGHLDIASLILSERETLKTALQAREDELSGLRLAVGRERAELQAQLKARGDELAAFRAASDRERDELKAQVAALETSRAELRSAFDQSGHPGNQTIEHQGASGGPEAAAKPLSAQRSVLDAVVGENNVVVPKTTLRQARAQFEYLAREFIPLGDIASQVMCELGAYTMDLALIAGQRPGQLPADEVALSILAPPSSNSLVNADAT